METHGFAALNLAPVLMKALATEGYTVPTPIQAQAIPPVMEGHDLLGIAQTGTGKTAAFALPILHRLAADRRRANPKGCRVLVLSPTRELASQIAKSFKAYGRNMGVSVAVIFGGVGYRPQVQSLERGVDVLIATPGRLIDHMQQKTANLAGTEIFVLDEADQMLDLGFVKPIRTIVAALPKQRQNLFFSATMPDAIGQLASDLLNDPVRVSVTPVAKTADRVTQKIIHVTAAAKKDVLTELFSDPAFDRAIVFTRTKRGADKVCQHLDKAGIGASAIHGNKSQAQRERALDGFRKGRTRALVATDIAARGIDIPAVSHVINFELPEVPESYVHRIGRTARAGADGEAISLCAPDERGLLRDIEKLIKQHIPSETRGDVGSIEIVERKPQRGRPQNQAPRKPNHRGQGPRSDETRSKAVRPERGEWSPPKDRSPRQDSARPEGIRQDNRRSDGQRFAEHRPAAAQGGHRTGGQNPSSSQHRNAPAKSYGRTPQADRADQGSQGQVKRRQWHR